MPGEAGSFVDYAEALRRAGVGAPTLVIDRDRLDANTVAVQSVVPAGKTVRLVAKSLPVPDLLNRVMASLGTNRVMTFSVAMLRQIEAALPGLDHLLGKPIPVAALAAMVNSDPEARDLAQRVTWLVDTEQRIHQYGELARSADLHLSVAVEVDVGLHRGGFAGARNLRSGLLHITSDPRLHYAGIMGYEPHLPALPVALGMRARAEADFRSTYAQALEIASEVFGSEAVEAGIRNTAGSKTLAERAGESWANDLSVGSLLVQPQDFAHVSSPAVTPAMFIATPVLKVVDPLLVPGFGDRPAVHMMAAAGARRGVYIHGGHWLADPVYPPGLRYSAVIGRSSNQELLVTRGTLMVTVDDYVFLHPHQSEAVMLQFGPIAVISDGTVVDYWQPLPPTA